jgi:hypothetical protein
MWHAYLCSMSTGSHTVCTWYRTASGLYTGRLLSSWTPAECGTLGPWSRTHTEGTCNRRIQKPSPKGMDRLLFTTRNSFHNWNIFICPNVIFSRTSKQSIIRDQAVQHIIHKRFIFFWLPWRLFDQQVILKSAHVVLRYIPYTRRSSRICCSWDVAHIRYISAASM